MTVFLRGDVYHYQFMIRGERYRGSTDETTLTRARIYEARKVAAIIESGREFRTEKAPLLSEVAQKFLAEIDGQVEARNLAANTARSYRNGWNLLAATDIAGVRIDRITRGAAAALSFPGGPWNARNAQTTLGRILHWCVDNDYIRAVPSIKRTKAKGRNMPVQTWMEEAILKHLDRDCADVFLIMLDCGMRPEEVMRMRWEDVDWVGARYFNPFGKTEESRRFVPMADRMREVLKSRSGNGSQWVFPTPRVTEITRDAALGMFAEGASIRAVSMALEISWPLAKDIREGTFKVRPDEHRVTVALQWEEARKAAGLDPKFVLYDARHWFAKTYLLNGGNVYTLMKLMGHADISTTMKYLHEDQDEARAVVNRRNHGLKIVKSA